MRNNVPGCVPPITPTAPHLFIPNHPPTHVVAPRRSPRTTTPAAAPLAATRVPRIRFVPIEGGIQNKKTITQEAVNFLTKCVWANSPNVFTPNKLKSKSARPAWILHRSHWRAISSYKCLMHDPTTSEVWQTAFGKDFGGMAQGDKKTGQLRTNSFLS